jgi:hypothetical protein
MEKELKKHLINNFFPDYHENNINICIGNYFVSGLFNISDKLIVSIDILLEIREFFKKGTL